MVGFVPKTVDREVLKSNNADLLLTAEDGRIAAVEVKLGHVMSSRQQENYEELPGDVNLYLAALDLDGQRLDPDLTRRWHFLSLTQIFAAWTDVEDEVSRGLAREAVVILQEWDQQLFGVFAPAGTVGSASLASLTQKFLARVATRRFAVDLRSRGRLAFAGVTSGGGLPLIQAWTPVRNEGNDRCFMAEVRWWGNKPGGELRFGVDFDPRPDEPEDEEVRRAAFDLANNMDNHIDFNALKEYLQGVEPRLAGVLSRETKSRPLAKGDWEQIVRHGFAGTPLPNGKKNGRKQTTPAFYGDGALSLDPPGGF
ncbi:hypothetical protein ACLRGI_01370 [Paenarthrobacter nitroguajacolicus]